VDDAHGNGDRGSAGPIPDRSHPARSRAPRRTAAGNAGAGRSDSPVSRDRLDRRPAAPGGRFWEVIPGSRPSRRLTWSRVRVSTNGNAAAAV